MKKWSKEDEQKYQEYLKDMAEQYTWTKAPRWPKPLTPSMMDLLWRKGKAEPE